MGADGLMGRVVVEIGKGVGKVRLSRLYFLFGER